MSSFVHPPNPITFNSEVQLWNNNNNSSFITFQLHFCIIVSRWFMFPFPATSCPSISIPPFINMCLACIGEVTARARALGERLWVKNCILSTHKRTREKKQTKPHKKVFPEGYIWYQFFKLSVSPFSFSLLFLLYHPHPSIHLAWQGSSIPYPYPYIHSFLKRQEPLKHLLVGPAPACSFPLFSCIIISSVTIL